MEYRTNRRTGDRISVIGLGTSGLPEADAKEQREALALAFEGGVNYFDLATGDASCFPAFADAFAGVREKVHYQLHFGADYSRGTYGWTTRADAIRRSVAAQLKALKTDTIDYAFIHCIDEAEDWENYQKNGALAYLLSLKEQGVAKHVGVSSHTPATVNAVLDSGLADMVMFSINPAYDYGRGDEYGRGEAEERRTLYRRCEAEGVGISVMKAFCGGQLLRADTSPFGRALTEYQCIAYALDTPGVLTVLPTSGSKRHGAVSERHKKPHCRAQGKSRPPFGEGRAAFLLKSRPDTATKRGSSALCKEGKKPQINNSPLCRRRAGK